MAGDAVEVLRRAFQAYDEGGPEAVFPLLAPEIEWTVRADLPDAGTYRGHAEVSALFGRFSEVMDDMWMRPEELIAIGSDVVVAPLRWGGRGKASGAAFEESRETWVATVRDGKIVRIREFATQDEAMAEARVDLRP
jgi:ketosteroid isomerase-like protein